MKRLCLVCVLSFSAAAYGEVDVILQTNFGDIGIDLYPEHAQITVDNFMDYVNSDFYDGLIFHRVVNTETFDIIQAGAFDADLNYHEPGGTIINEPGLSNVYGTVAMAKLPGNPDSATSQFFINLTDNSSNLDIQNGGFTVFGRVVTGMDVAEAIGQTPTHTDTLPGIGEVSGVPVSSVIIYDVVPEPATVALLSMGALLLRKRR